MIFYQTYKIRQKYMSIQPINTNVNKTVKFLEEMTDEEVEVNAFKAQKAFINWKETSYHQRAHLLHKVATLLRIRKPELAKNITLDMGKPLAQAEIEIYLSADILDYYADNGEAFLAKKVLDPEFGTEINVNSPVGVLLGVIPENFPFYQVVRFAAPKIMAGNTILLKHASVIPKCAAAMEMLYTEAEAPDGLYTNLFISSKRTSKPFSDERIKGIFSTGSEETGANDSTKPGNHLKKSELDLGGNDMFIIL